MDPADAISQNRVILETLLGHMQSLQDQIEIESGGDGSSIALLLESIIEDAQDAAELMSGDEPSYVIEDDKFDVLALQDSIRDMTASQVESVAREFASKIEELVTNTYGALNIVKEAEQVINVGDARYHRRATTVDEEWNEGDFQFGQSHSTRDGTGWGAYIKAGGLSIPQTPNVSKYGKRNYVKMPTLKHAEKLRKQARQKGNQHLHKRRLQDRDECRPRCDDIEDWRCNCERLFECTNKLSLYDFTLMFLGGYVSTLLDTHCTLFVLKISLGHLFIL